MGLSGGGGSAWAKQIFIDHDGKVLNTAKIAGLTLPIILLRVTSFDNKIDA